jgi:hypothetical protein
MTFTVRDADRAIHSHQHGSLLDLLVAGLSAEPETIEELDAALLRFVQPGPFKPLAGWQGGDCDEPYDAGICILDLAARLVATESTYSTPSRRGEILYRNTERDIETELPYHVSEDWQFVNRVDGWEGLAESRRQDRQSAPRLDARTVLYGRVADFIVGECVAARMPIAPGSPWAPPEGWSLVALPERAKAGQGVEAADAVAEIHARWLMTPRDDLGGRCPRDVLLDKREHLEWDLQDRCQQWSMLGQCPPPLGEETAAFRLGGMGTHENIVYYDLVRWLIGECWQRVVEPAADAAASAEPQADVSAWLRQVQDDWLNEPDWEDFGGRTAAEVIRDERQRIPMAMSGKEAMVDDDCPLCQMLGESISPMFWHLDGCNMDEDFPFSIHQRTRQQWEEEQRGHEEFNRKFEEEWKCRRAVLESEVPGSEPSDGLSIWTRSFSNPDVGQESPWIRLFGIGCHVAELTTDLKTPPGGETLVKSLGRCFGNMRAALNDPSAALLEPVIERFCETLGAAADSRPDLAMKCADLERQLCDFATMASGDERDLPF